MVVDVFVFLQDKGGLLENDIVKDIFGKIFDKQFLFNLMKYGDVCFQKF